MFASELSANDMDQFSFCDNSMYVLPPKTELNSSFYIQKTDSLFLHGINTDKSDISQRKISSNIDIPTYKGFSIANGYSTNIRKANYLPKNQKPLLINVHSENTSVSRKVHLLSGNSTFNDDFGLMKKTLGIKHKFKPKTDDEKLNSKVDKDRKKSMKRVETFLGENLRRPNHNIIKNTSNDTNSNNNKTLSYNHKQADNIEVQNYIKQKRDNSRKMFDKKKYLEKERKEKIEERLKLLSQKIKVSAKIPKAVQRDFKISKDRKKEEKPKSLSNLESDNSSKGTLYDSSSESEKVSQSINAKLSQWSPMDVDELERHMLQSKNYMRGVNNANRQTGSILTDIMVMSEKMMLAKHELMKFSNRRLPEQYNIQDDLNEDILFEIKDVGSESNEFESDDESYSPDLEKIALGHKYIDEIRKEVAPSILANRARRKLDLDNNDESDECDNTESAYNDCVTRLIQENEKRYERSSEPHNAIMLPVYKSLPNKLAHSVKQNNVKYTKIIEILKNDKLTFMNTYRRCQQNVQNKFERTSTVNTNNSKVSYDESISISSSLHRSTRQSIDTSKKVTIENDDCIINQTNYQKESTADLVSQKSVSVAFDNNYENINSSHTFSDVEDSSSVNHIQQSILHKIPRTVMRYPIKEGRLSPNSLERQLSIALHYNDGLQASMEQLLQADRFQGVGFAQQETVSLAQILKARQWKDARDIENNENLQKFTTALDNLNKYHPSRYNKITSTSRSGSTSYTISTNSSDRLTHRKGKSTTESEASEIEEEIVDFYSNSTDSQYHSNQVNNHQNNLPTPNLNNKSVKPDNKTFISKSQEIKNYSDSVVELDIPRSKVDESIQEISTVNSVSKSSDSEMLQKSSSKISTVETIDTQSLSAKSVIINNANESSSKHTDNDSVNESFVKSVKTDSNFTRSEKSSKEVSTAKSFESEIKSKGNSYSTSKSSTFKSESKSTISNSTEKNPITKSELNMTNYSKDEFDTNSDLQKSSSESEIINRVNLLIKEKEKKEKLVEKLTHQLTIVKQHHKAKTLRDYIDCLDSQIEILKDELKNPNLSSSSFSLSPIVAVKKRKPSKEMKILPTLNRKSTSSSSSSSTISKDEDIKSQDESISSSTLISDGIKDKSAKGQIGNKRIEEVETPRSLKQIQFGDINEEYSASERDSSELKTPSEKSRLSKEVFDVNTKSKSENFHILLINEQNNEDGPNIAVNDNDDLKMMSARTIHSEISDIPMDNSDQEIDDFSDKIDESEKIKNIDNQNLYSEDFSDVSSHKTSKSLIVTELEVNEISQHEEKIAYEPSSESSKSSENSPPLVPLRKKLILQSSEDKSPHVSDNLIDVMPILKNICDGLLNKILDELVDEKDLFIANISHNEDILNASIDSLNDKPTDHKFAALARLIPWNDETIHPLVDLAIEQLFNARQQREGKTMDAFNKCLENLPQPFVEINSEAETTRLYNLWQYYRACDMNTEGIDKIFTQRIAIYCAVLDVMQNIYELDDESKPVPWMNDVFNATRNRKLILWQGSDAPNSIDLVTEIVKKELSAIRVLNNPEPQSIKKSRQHQWFHKQTNDFVERLLIDETLHDDLQWQMYDKAVEKTIYMVTDEINEMLLDELLPI